MFSLSTQSKLVYEQMVGLYSLVSNGESGQYYRAEGMCCTDSCPVKQTFLIV